MTTSRVDLRGEPGWGDRHCRDANPDDFHQRDGERWEKAGKRITAAAVFFCEGCPIRRACRVAGRSAGGWGLWGGVAYRRDGQGRLLSTDLLADRTRAG